MNIGESALRFFMCTVFTGHYVFYQCEIKELLISATDKNRSCHLFPGINVLLLYLELHTGQSDW